MIIAGLSYIGPKIAPDYRPRITAKFIMIIMTN